MAKSYYNVLTQYNKLCKAVFHFSNTQMHIVTNYSPANSVSNFRVCKQTLTLYNIIFLILVIRDLKMIATRYKYSFD